MIEPPSARQLKSQRTRMSDAVATVSPSPSPKKAKAAKPKKPRTSPDHPKVSEMVNSAITSLKERGGSSLQAIKKYIASHYKVDVEKLAPFIKKYLKTSVTNGTLIQTKGKGASGSFKLSASGKPKDKVKKPVKPETKKTAKAKKPLKKAAKPKKTEKRKSVEKPKKAAVVEKKKVTKPKKAKTPKKEKKAKSPKKPKSPKPKKAAAKKVAKK